MAQNKSNPIKWGRKKNNGMTSQELADVMNVSRQTVSMWENKKRTPSVQTIIDLARILDLALEDLMLFYKEEEA